MESEDCYMQGIKTLFNLRWLTLVVALVFFSNVDRVAAQSVLFGAAHTAAGESVLYRIDPSTGEATEVGPIGYQGCNGMDFDASWTLYATCKSAQGNLVLITIDQDTGAGQLVGDSGILLQDDALEIGSDISFRNSDGALFGFFLDSDFGDFLGTIDPSTGGVSEVAMGSLVEFGNGLAFSLTDELLQAGSLIRPSGLIYSKLHTLDQVADANGFLGISSNKNLTFSSTPEGTSLTKPRINASDFEPRTGILFASVNNGETESYLAIVNVKSGQVTLLGKTQDSLDAIAFVPVNTEATSTTPTGAPYLKCNKVARGRYINRHEEVEVMLQNSSGSVKVRVSRPESLCTVLYDDGGVLTESTTTLACYRVKNVMRHRRNGHHLSFEWRHVYIDNEFGEEQTLSVNQHQTLCVPSEIKDDQVKIKTNYHQSHHPNCGRKYRIRSPMRRLATIFRYRPPTGQHPCPGRW